MEDLAWCIDCLKAHNRIKEDVPAVFSSFRALMNITMPRGLSEEYYARQGKVLRSVLAEKQVIDISAFPDGVSLFKGDITLLKADAIVNACNSQMLGCFIPGHHCIDNAIHSFAGLEVRRDMMEIMEKQGHDEPNGQVKVTSGYNLPAKYIFHTVGPVYSGIPQDEKDLKSCYLHCLEEADSMGLSSLVFCSLSTGVFGYPVEKACRVAINAVRNYMQNGHHSLKKVVFDVFSPRDLDVYQEAFEEFGL